MKTKLRRLTIIAFLTCLIAFRCVSPTASAATRTWTGGGADNNWTTAANWDAAVAAGDNLVFPGSAPSDSLVNTNDFASNTTFGSITISGTNYLLRGASIFLTNGISAQSGATNTVALSVVVEAFQDFTNAVAGGTLIVGNFNAPVYLNLHNLRIGALGRIEIAGEIIGSGNLTKTGPGTLQLRGSSANTFVGTTSVAEGVLELGKAAGVDAMPGALTIGDDLGAANSAVVRLFATNQINDSVTVTLNSDGLLDLNNQEDTVGPLIFNGGDIATGTGTLFMSANATVNPNVNSQSLVSGRLNLGSATRTFSGTGHNWSPDIRITAVVGGSSGLIMNASQYWELALAGTNNYTGLTTVNGGALEIFNASALGDPIAGTVVNAGATLTVFSGTHVGAEALTLNGGVLDSRFGSNSWAGPITLAAGSTVNVVFDTDFLNFTGSISGSGALLKTGLGTLIYSGALANGYSGATTVNSGTLLLAKTAGVTALSGPLVIGDGAGGPDADVVRLRANSQIQDDTVVTINSSGLLDADGFTEVVGPLSGTGDLQLDASIFSVGLSGGTVIFSGTISGSGSLIRNGAGFWILNGTNTFSGGFTVNGPTFVNGILPANGISVFGTLGGTGTVGRVNLGASGTLSPGLSPGRLTSSNVTFVAGSTFQVELNGPNPGTGYDQLKVNGGLTLASATLNASLGFLSASNASFTIIDNDGSEAVTNTFNGLPEGAGLNINGTPFQISYVGGSGNDVVLTQLAATRRPVLNISRGPITNVVLAWETNFTGFTLESNANLNTTVWTAVSPAPAVSGTNNVVTNTVNGTQNYYRLRAP
jgi:autotransporter-associated beta strand protein